MPDFRKRRLSRKGMQGKQKPRKPKARKATRFAPTTPPVELIIESVGGRGDGMATAPVEIDHETRERTFFVPWTLAGERVLSRPVQYTGEGVTAEPLEILEPSPDRVEPHCRHFMACGGCALQHQQENSYKAWKRDLVIRHLGRAGIPDTLVGPLVGTDPGTRRRADLVIRRTSDRLIIGYHERRSERIIDLEECPVLAPAIVCLVGGLRMAAKGFLEPGETADVTINQLDNGLDLLLTLPGDLTLAARETMSRFAEEHDLARISFTITNDRSEPEPLVERRVPEIRFGDVTCHPQPGAFLQATAGSEALLTERVTDLLSDHDQIIELFAGIGTFTLPLLTDKRITAVELDRAAITALDHAARNHRNYNNLSTREVNLMSDPILSADLDGYDAALLDPPRAGAKTQIMELAQSGISRIVYVSCNPATFARDAAILTDAGFTPGQVTPVDQFLWSPHVELVGVFDRGPGHG